MSPEVKEPTEPEVIPEIEENIEESAAEIDTENLDDDFPVAIVIVCVAVFLAILALVCGIWYCLRKKRHQTKLISSQKPTANIPNRDNKSELMEDDMSALQLDIDFQEPRRENFREPRREILKVEVVETEQTMEQLDREGFSEEVFNYLLQS